MFAALTPPEGVLAELEEFLRPRAEDPVFRWTLPEQWHLTLAFYAQVAPPRVEELIERLGRAGRRRSPFVLRLAGGGAFGSVAHAKVLYLGVEASPQDREELRRLAVGARSAASRCGIAVEGGRFRPHLTLARTRRPVEATRWVRLLDSYRSRPFEVDRFALVESFLGQGPGNRPRYDVVAELPVGHAGRSA